MQTTRIFQSGNSQAIRLPREFRLNARRVTIRRIGRSIVVEPLADDFSSFVDMLNEFSDDFMSAGRSQPPVQQRDGF